MAACIDQEFEDWLCGKLKELKTDPDVFASYIRGILEGDETPEEKLDALQGILVEITAEDIPKVSMEIIHKWDNVSAVAQNIDPSKFDVDARLASIMEKQAQSVVNERKVSEEERKYREAILAQYSQISDEEDDAENCDYKGTMGSVVYSADSSEIAAVTKNTNAEDVAKAEKEKRDKAKAECEKKKAADKANKEKQKQQQQERKEKEKKRTLKGERKR